MADHRKQQQHIFFCDNCSAPSDAAGGGYRARSVPQTRTSERYNMLLVVPDLEYYDDNGRSIYVNVAQQPLFLFTKYQPRTSVLYKIQVIVAEYLGLQSWYRPIVNRLKLDCNCDIVETMVAVFAQLESIMMMSPEAFQILATPSLPVSINGGLTQGFSNVKLFELILAALFTQRQIVLHSISPTLAFRQLAVDDDVRELYGDEIIATNADTSLYAPSYHDRLLYAAAMCTSAANCGIEGESDVPLFQMDVLVAKLNGASDIYRADSFIIDKARPALYVAYGRYAD